MKNKLLLLLLLFAITTNVQAQKDKSKDVKTKYLSVPAYDLSAVDGSAITAEFSTGNAAFGTEKLKDTKSTCVPKGGGLKDAIEVTTYYYEIPVTYAESYLVAKDPSGNIVYASQVSKSDQGVIKFGFNKCEYWISDKMKKDWASKGSSFKSGEFKKYEDEMYKRAIGEARSNVYLSYIEENFAVYGAKGKAFDYAELDAAFDKALTAYKNIAKAGPNESDFKLLNECISVWEKELETVNSDDKKARISKTIAKGLHENCVRAYMYMYNSEKAVKHGRSFKKLFGNFSSNRTNAIDFLMKRIEIQKIAVDKNKALVGDISGLSAKANTDNKVVKVLKLNSSNFSRLKAEHFKFRGTQHSEVMDERKKEEEDAIADGSLNPYQKYVMDAAGGPVLLMTMAPSALTGFPELKELPVEMCNLEGLTQLVIMNNKIETVPSEIGNLTDLTKLDLTGNNISSIPPEIGKLTKLKTLRLGKNPIESLPEEIANCKNLKSINLKGCKLSAAAQQDLASWLPNCKIKY